MCVCMHVCAQAPVYRREHVDLHMHEHPISHVHTHTHTHTHSPLNIYHQEITKQGNAHLCVCVCVCVNVCFKLPIVWSVRQ